MTKWVLKWMSLWSSQYQSPPVLDMILEDEQIHILDTRTCAVQREQVLTGLAYWVYLACDHALSPNGLVKELRLKGIANSWEEIQTVVQDLQNRKILLNLHGRLLSLAVRKSVSSQQEPQDLFDGYVDLPYGYLDIESYMSNQTN